MRFNIKPRLAALGRTQKWLIEQLRDWGIEIHPTDFSKAIHNKLRTPKGDRVLEIADRILLKYEYPNKKAAKAE